MRLSQFLTTEFQEIVIYFLFYFQFLRIILISIHNFSKLKMNFRHN